MNKNNPTESERRHISCMADMAAILIFVFLSMKGDRYEIHRVDWNQEGENPYRKWASPHFQ